jgi:hypothetical protein
MRPSLHLSGLGWLGKMDTLDLTKTMVWDSHVLLTSEPVRLRSELERAFALRVDGRGRRLVLLSVTHSRNGCINTGRLTQEIHVRRRNMLCTRDPLYIANGRSWRNEKFWVHEDVL